MWSIKKIESHGFKLLRNDRLWCHFVGHGFDVFINLDTKSTNGNMFNFHSHKNSFKGNFKAELNDDSDMEFLLRVIK